MPNRDENGAKNAERSGDFHPKIEDKWQGQGSRRKSKQKAILGEIREKRRTQNKARTLDFCRVENQAAGYKIVNRFLRNFS